MQEKKLTIMFHVDDSITACASSGIVTECVKRLDAACGTQDPLTVTIRKKHECLCMTMDFDVEDVVALVQHDFIKKLWNDVLTGIKQKNINVVFLE